MDLQPSPYNPPLGYTNRSITNLTGASQQLMAAASNRRSIIIHNPNAANPIAVNLVGGAAALNTGGSIMLPAGATLQITSFSPVGVINVIGTAADDVTAYEGLI